MTMRGRSFKLTQPAFIAFVVIMLLLSTFVLVSDNAKGAATIYSTQTGDWKDTATWLDGVVPGTTDTVYIGDGHTVTMDDDRTTFLIYLNTTATLQIGDTVPATSVTLTFDDTAGAGFADVAGFLGTLKVSGSASYTMYITSAGSPPTNYWNGHFKFNAIQIVNYANITYSNGFWLTGATSSLTNSNVTDSDPADSCVFLIKSNVAAIQNINTGNCWSGLSAQANMAGIDNFVVFSGTTHDITVTTTGSKVEFINSNFDTADAFFSVPGVGTSTIISDSHNDIAGDYKIIVEGSSTRTKSTITNKHASGDNIELISGTYTVDQASASNDFTINSGATLDLDYGQTHTFDADANLTNSGTAKLNGTVTTGSGYFDFYTPGNLWLNNSTISNVDLNYYLGGFNFSVGNSANSTIYDWTLESPSGIDTAFNITNHDFSNKGSGVVWHMNATASSGSVKFVTGNLTSGETYEVYIAGGLDNSGTADSGNYYNFSYSGWSTKAIYLTWASGVCPTLIYSITTGTWQTAGTWKDNCIPGTGDTAVIDDGDIVTMDDNRAAANVTVNSTATLNLTASTTLTLDAGANVTVGGLLNMTGANLTVGSGYFDFYNPGQVWLNDSTVTDADLVLTFDFYIAGTNSTLNNYTANVGNDMLLQVSSETYANKGAGIVWHMNATLTSCSTCFEVVEFLFGNLTTGEDYRLYNNGALVGTETANATGIVFFTSTIDDSADHLNLTAPPVTPPTPPSGWGTSWLHKPVAYFEYGIKSFKTVLLLGEERGKYGNKDPDDYTYSWDFGDGSETENGMTTTHTYTFFLVHSYEVELTVCEKEKEVCDSYQEEVRLIDWPMVALIIVLIIALILAVIGKRYSVRERT